MADVRVATVTLRTDRPAEVARFWRDLFDYSVASNHSNSVLLVGEGPALLIQPGEREQTSAIHLDLRPDDQQACLERALALGATPADIGQSGDEPWFVMADPGGNVFCILPSESEHRARLEADPGRPTPI